MAADPSPCSAAIRSFAAFYLQLFSLTLSLLPQVAPSYVLFGKPFYLYVLYYTILLLAKHSMNAYVTKQ